LVAAIPVGGAASDASNVRQAVPFFWVRDLTTSIRFYVDGLGFRMTKQWIDEGQLRWCWLELGDAALMLQQFWRDGPHHNTPTGQTGLGVSIYFICRDAVAIYRDLVARGLPAARPQVGNGMWVTHVSDPDGYAIFFESPTNVPEDTVYAERP
jgi:lactoylglutathione lyase